jgi:hypothetical protein
VLELNEPLDKTVAITPFRDKWYNICCIQAKLALPFGGVPYFQRASSCKISTPHSFWLKGGLAKMKSAFKSSKPI